MRFALALLLAAGTATLAAGAMEPLPLGAPAPRITAPDQDGAPVDFHAETAHGATVVYFYPKAGTPGCTAQACSLRDADEALRQRGIRVIGVSLDPIATQHDFHARNGLNFRLVADPERIVADSFGVAALPNGRDQRETFLIRDGIVVWRQLEAIPETQGTDVVKAYDSLGAKASPPPAS